MIDLGCFCIRHSWCCYPVGALFFVQNLPPLPLIDGLAMEMRKDDRPAQPQIKQELKGRFDRNDELAEGLAGV